MSRRYLAGFVQAGLFNPLVAPTPSGYTYELWSWGGNGFGQLGLGDITTRSSPVQVGALTDWLNIAGGVYYNIATKTDGTLWAWGRNIEGQLGLGNTTNRLSPVQVGALTTWSKVSAGGSFTLATKTDGTLWSWGYNGQGQLGLNTATTYFSSPVQVGALTTWSKVSAGGGFTLATKTDGTLWSWGKNNNGQLGLGDITNRSSPVQVGALTTWLNVSAGYGGSTLVTKTDGTLWSWGGNLYGELGLSTSGAGTYKSSPNQVGALTTWSNIDAGYQKVLTTKTDGTLWTWGRNNLGQLGLGNITNYSSPKQVGALTTWSKVSAGGALSTIATKTDGTLWAWGRNNVGQLGLGNTTTYSSPKQVGALTTWLNVSAGCDTTLALKY